MVPKPGWPDSDLAQLQHVHDDVHHDAVVVRQDHVSCHLQLCHLLTSLPEVNKRKKCYRLLKIVKISRLREGAEDQKSDKFHVSSLYHVSWTNNSPNICHMSTHVMAGRDEETSSNPRVVTLETFNMYLATQDCVTLESATYHGPTSAAWSRVTVTCPPTWWPGVMTICWISATGRLNLFRVY